MSVREAMIHAEPCGGVHPRVVPGGGEGWGAAAGDSPHHQFLHCGPPWGCAGTKRGVQVLDRSGPGSRQPPPTVANRSI